MQNAFLEYSEMSRKLFSKNYLLALIFFVSFFIKTKKEMVISVDLKIHKIINFGKLSFKYLGHNVLNFFNNLRLNQILIMTTKKKAGQGQTS